MPEECILCILLLANHISPIEEESLMHGLHFILFAIRTDHFALRTELCTLEVHLDLVDDEEEGLERVNLLSLPSSSASFQFALKDAPLQIFFTEKPGLVFFHFHFAYIDDNPVLLPESLLLVFDALNQVRLLNVVYIELLGHFIGIEEHEACIVIFKIWEVLLHFFNGLNIQAQRPVEVILRP